MNRPLRLLLSVGLIGSPIAMSQANAVWSQIPSTDFQLAPPPVDGSAAYKRDIQVILDYQQTRTQADCDLAQSMVSPSFDAIFGKSGLLTDSENANVGPFVQKVMKLADRIASYQKEQFRRPRPFNEDSRIQPCITKPGGAKAYPSGHATLATAGACVLALLLPAKADAIVNYGAHVSQLRMIAGVHHPTDIDAGQYLGGELCKRLNSEPDFERELNQLKAN